MSHSCKYFDAKQCLSCSLLDRSYPEQLRLKEQYLRTCLKDAGIPTPDIRPMVPSDPIFGSRGKAKLAVGRSPGGMVIGFPDAKGNITSVEECPLHDFALNRLALAALHRIRARNLTPYDVPSKTGELKYLLSSRAKGTGELMLRFVLRSEKEEGLCRAIADELAQEVTALKVCSINLQPEHKAVVEGRTEKLLTERGFIKEILGGIQLAFPPQSFSQVTPNIAEKLYLAARDSLKKRRPEKVLDLYCGVGAFSLFAAAACGEVTGVEISPSAIAHAGVAADMNSISNCRFIAGDARTLIRDLSFGYDLWIVNPPRRGLDEEVRREILGKLPPCVVYSSCNPVTLARDLKILSPSYRIVDVQPFDMFPLTPHFETLVTLDRL